MGETDTSITKTVISPIRWTPLLGGSSRSARLRLNVTNALPDDFSTVGLPTVSIAMIVT